MPEVKKLPYIAPREPLRFYPGPALKGTAIDGDYSKRRSLPRHIHGG